MNRFFGALLAAAPLAVLVGCGDEGVAVDVTFDVTSSAGANGSITPATAEVRSGVVHSVVVTPNDGFAIDEVSGCGGTLDGNVYTTAAITADCEIIATFAANRFEVSASAGVGGSIAPAAQNVAEGGRATIAVTPNAGFMITGVTGCGGTLAGNAYTTGEITRDCEVVATFAANPAGYAVTATAGAGGTISPASQGVNMDGMATFALTPEAGYAIDTVTGCGGTLVGNAYTTAAVTASCAVLATFYERPIVRATVVDGTGGFVSPASQAVDRGATATVEFTAIDGYMIDTVTGCGGTLVDESTSFTTGAVTEDCDIEVRFVRSRFTVLGALYDAGSILPQSQTVASGSTGSVTIVPADGYKVATVTGCGGTLEFDTYTTGPVTEDCSIAATFERIVHTVSATAGSGGSIDPSSREVGYGETATFTVKPNSGFIISSVSGCGGSRSGTTYTTGDITEDCTVSATFERAQLIAAGGFHTCGLASDGYRCWGQNSSGQLGVASRSLTAYGDEMGESPATGDPVTLLPDLSLVSISLGTQHSCAVGSDDNVYCWGEAQNGQIGLGVNADRKVITSAVDLDGEAVAQVSAGGQFTCARLVSGDVRCWGLNSSGELGIGDANTRFVAAGAVDFDGEPVAQLVTGAAHACALLENGEMYCWGDNSSGQLGDRDGGNDSATPALVDVSGNVTQIAAGGLFACVIVDDTVRCWGENGSGQLGNNDGTNTDLDRPGAALDLDGEIPVRLALGGEHACVLTAEGSIFCWGESDAGQTGQNDTTDDIRPQRVSLSNEISVLDIDAGNDHTCIVFESTFVPGVTFTRCWGEGGVGQLGLMSTNDIGDNEIVDNEAFDILLP